MKKKLSLVMIALMAVAAFAATMSVTMSRRTVTELTVISEATTWDFSKLTANTSSEYYASEGIKLTDASTPTKNDEFIYANYLTTFFTADASFKADAIAFKGEYPIRKNKYSQNGILHFKTSVAGKIVVSFNDTGSTASATAVKRYLVVNDVQTEYWTSRENNSENPDVAYPAQLNVTSGEIAVPAGDVTITGSSAIQVSKIVFTPEGGGSGGATDIVYDFAAAATAGENPDNWNYGTAFYGWENEGKTYSKRQDYKGYTNYAGTNLPAECHVFRRSDRINGNIADGGLKCPSQKEMAINGLTAGSKVVIEYTGEGQMLYATGYDPANATAEPNTVAIVGDGNKAAISGSTAIPSGTPIHIVSTDNGYFVFRVLKNMVITKITISEETPIDPTTVVKPNKVLVADGITTGTVKVSQAQAFAGDEVTVTATPNDGFKLEAITVTGVNTNEAVTVTDGKFTMIADDVTVNATFTDTRIIYDFAAAATAGENPDNWNFGSAFYGWENEGKTYSKRQDYKGYTNYAGTNLPAECHVFRRSDRINGNIADGGLKCPSQKEMAINGLTAGSKVVIEYTGEGQMLYATGYDPANATAEPNTVAIVGDGNKAAISGTTAIPSGTPIHIVSTDNGYFVFRVLKNMVITKITISEETPIDPATVVKPNKVTVATGIENGTVKVSQAQAFAGDEVTVTATPNDGFKLESISVRGVTTDEAVTVTDGKFTMIADDVTVNATFTDTRIIYDFAAAATAGENPDNWNFGSAFYGWENEGKTYSKRQDYKGYTNYAGTNLPAECHVFRRSDRINGNIADGGLKCPSQKEMAINGLTAGSKVVIEYTGEGQMLYATGYDPANATAEPNTVAIVGDGNKAAISGTTAIPSGTPIHIVSTDNGYFVFRVLKNMVITKITISEETPIDPATVIKPNKVTLGTAEGGTVKVSQAQAFEGDKVYATFTPAEGYSPSGIVGTFTNDAGEDVTKDITFGEDETGKYIVMPAFNITVSVVFKPLPKFYIIGEMNSWDRTAMTEMTYNAETEKYEYDYAPTTTVYFAFADYQQTAAEAEADATWETFNSTYRYSLGSGNVDATIGEIKSLTKGVDGTIVLQPGTYKISVEKDFNAVTITGEVAPPPAEDTYVVAGAPASLFGTEWSGNAEANKMTKNTETGLYELKFTGVAFTAATTIEYKIVKNSSIWIPDGVGNNQTVSIPAAGTYDITFTFNPEGSVITGVATVATGIGIINVGGVNDIFSDGKPVYNLSGQRVFKGYKGVVIKNGKKIVVK